MSHAKLMLLVSSLRQLENKIHDSKRALDNYEGSKLHIYARLDAYLEAVEKQRELLGNVLFASRDKKSVSAAVGISKLGVFSKFIRDDVNELLSEVGISNGFQAVEIHKVERHKGNHPFTH